MKRGQRAIVTGAVAALVMLSGTADARADQFQITIENLSPNVLTPVPFIAHDSSFDLFDAGAAVSPEIELLAEDGVPDGVVRLATAGLGTSVSSFGVAFGPGGPLGPGESAVVTIKADAAHPWLSFASMLAFSNDAFIGFAAGDGALDLFPGGRPFRGSFTLKPSAVWDSGTEVNDELAKHVPALGSMLGAGIAENGTLSRPHPGIRGAGQIPLSRNWVNAPVARITIVPEPASAALLGLAGALFLARRR